MGRELWALLYHCVRDVGKDFTPKYVQIQPWVLVCVSLWAALHERPVGWACDGRHWEATALRPPRLPSPSVMSRRAYRVGTGLLWHALGQRLRACAEEYPALIALLDGKPLPVGGCTKDKGAAYGRGAGTMAKGYKLHTIWSNRPLPEQWEVTPLKVGETTAADELLLRQRRSGSGGGYLPADGNYDSSELFDDGEAGAVKLERWADEPALLIDVVEDESAADPADGRRTRGGEAPACGHQETLPPSRRHRPPRR
jgi:hypothetical protein